MSKACDKTDVHSDDAKPPLRCSWHRAGKLNTERKATQPINGEQYKVEEDEKIEGVMMDNKYMQIPQDSPFEQMLEKFKYFDISNLASAHSGYDYEAINRQMHENIRSIEVESIIPDDYFEKTQEYQQKSLEVLQSIRENTANLYTMVELISRSNDKQDQLISLIAEVFSLAKAKSKEEADTMFKKIMGKINDTADSVDSIIKIVGWATTVYSMVLPLLP